MKEKLINFLENHQSLSWKIDASDYEFLKLAINDFFDTYQPERLNPEEEFDSKVYNDPNSDYWKFEHESLCDSLNPVERLGG